MIYTIKQNKKRHFFGSIVSVYNADGQNLEFLIIDGQQRITTVSLLLLAMHNLLEKGIITSENAILKQKIHDEFLVDKYQPEDKRIKLKPVKDDQNAFNSLFGDEEDYIITSGVIANYNYFYDRILKHELTIDQLYDAVCKLEVIDIKLTPPDDDPQLIFESLNSTGLDLSEGDKIRNFILMGLPSSLQDKLYTMYWNKIEQFTNYDVSSFIRHYLTIKQNKIPNIKKVHQSFKEYIEAGKLEIEPVLDDLLKYARNYYKLINANSGIKELDSSIYRLIRLETSVTYPYFLEVLGMYDRREIDLEDLVNIFLTIENYLFRRIVCDLPSHSHNKVFSSLHKDVMKHTSSSSYLEILNFILLSKQGNSRFPDDATFKKALSSKDMYIMTNKNKWYLFERLENKNSVERIEIYKMLDDGKLSIEHIMPQTLNDDWIIALGRDYDMIHKEWLHKLANLTLTAYNSKYSNSSFLRKRDMNDGYRDSGLRMNLALCDFEKWTKEELEIRQSTLIETALHIWAPLQTEFVPEKEVSDAFALDDDIDFTGKKVSELILFDKTFTVSSWTMFYQKVLTLLHEKDETILNKLALNQMNSDLTTHVDRTSENYRASIQIDDNIYVWSNTNTQSKINCLLKFFKLYDIDPSELLFTVQNSATDTDEIENNRYDIRVRFWEHLLKEFNIKSTLFSNIAPHKDSWLTSGAGIASGVQYAFNVGRRYCSAQIEFYSNSKDKNKAYFDKMFERKSEIESKFGSALIWERKDNNLHSKIRAINTDANIFDEDTWDEVCGFLINSMIRLHDVVQPILKEITTTI